MLSILKGKTTTTSDLQWIGLLNLESLGQCKPLRLFPGWLYQVLFP